MDNKANRVGFTLVEMIVVVALVDVLMFTAPSFVNMIKSNE
jgi:prepilin-type N-terminal cleavage/methylation domain-containing protein